MKMNVHLDGINRISLAQRLGICFAQRRRDAGNVFEMLNLKSKKINPVNSAILSKNNPVKKLCDSATLRENLFATLRENLTKVAILFLAFAVCTAHAQRINVGTYNIRLYNDGDTKKGDGWAVRCPAVSSLVRFHDFDIWGAQEVVHNQLLDLLAALPEYGYTGVCRDDGKTKGEASPIFYKKSRFELLKDGHFWLSEQTDTPNKGWDAACIRICSWGEFKDKESGKAFWFFNLHMDHIGVVARAESAKLVLARIRSMTCGQPVILTGDFNVDQHNPGYKLIAESGLLRDAYEICAVRYAPNGTFNNFNPQCVTDSRIDHIFVTEDFKVERYGILTDTYAPKEGPPRLPSDHYPVKAVLTR